MSKRVRAFYLPSPSTNIRSAKQVKSGVASVLASFPRPSSSRGPGDQATPVWDQCENHDEPRAPTSKRIKNSPILSQLQSRSDVLHQQDGKKMGFVYAAQRELEKKHHDAKSKVHRMSGLGGGVSMWPAMDDMRLSRREVNWLVISCGLLIITTMSVFLVCHGKHITRLRTYTEKLDKFHDGHKMNTYSDDQLVFNSQLMKWHLDFYSLLESIQADFNTVWSKASLFDTLFIILYVSGVGVLLYFLVDNMFSKSRLTPQRIKAWISLLCVVTTWTILSFHLLMSAQALETAAQRAVHSLSNELSELVQSDLDLTRYDRILLYWRTRCLPPTSSGVLSIMGILQVIDVAYYFQYYSLPVLTALCTPIIKIMLSLKSVYWP